MIMKLTNRNQLLNSLKFILSLSLVTFSIYSGPANGMEENDKKGNADTTKNTSVTQRKPFTKTIPTDEQFRNNPKGMCGRACQNLSSCQKDEELNKVCWEYCPQSGCVKRGKKPESATTESK
jgi:hypothetical protein